ncbi:N-acetylmuramoyl-L-alanine amidase [Clostridium sardiniense]|uniref:N-acetylmuramoyl-L-alanine amidase n=1 Tax=Clostridium sardiniense TaxID=29369 RepID=A0ABS7KVA3_CLOSR|nr:N-acetylmuramoyl-L-alanine amidase [Clostridium sardiniense]MBY0754522.1 N-acetylmuramoyl-L-alanine amidase [Clostridium sardiniense]MDQ0460882.1 hypothetical protein [Clostridium sardiniense]
MNKLTMGVNDGHTISGPGSGAVGRIVEGKETRMVGGELRRLLANSGVNVVNCTIDKASSTSQSLELVVRQANRQDLDWFIAIHFNAGGGRGVEVYTYKGRQYADAVEVCKNISKLGFINRGVKEGTGLYVIRKTKAKSMLIECCFVDTDDANKYLQVGYKAIAKAIAEAVVDTVNSTEPIKPSNPTKKELWELSISGPIVKELQEEINDQGFGSIKVDSYFGENTLKCCPIIRYGAIGNITKIAQKRLNALGYSTNGIDGKFFDGTKKAVIELQKANGLDPDGVIGKNTWNALFRK